MIVDWGGTHPPGNPEGSLTHVYVRRPIPLGDFGADKRAKNRCSAAALSSAQWKFRRFLYFLAFYFYLSSIFSVFYLLSSIRINNNNNNNNNNEHKHFSSAINS